MGIDSVGFTADNPTSFNRYTYANNNPYSFTDPDGRSPAPTDLFFFGKDVGSLLVNEIVYVAAVILGDDAVANLAIQGIKDTRINAIESTVGLISPVPGTGQGIRAIRTADNVVDAARVTKGRAALDNNALVAAIEKGETASVDAVLGGRTPLVSRQAVREFLVRGDKQELRQFLSARGGSVARSGTQANVEALQTLASSMGRSLKIKDARVAASAQTEGVSLITRDRKLRNFLNASGLKGESF